VTLCDSGPLVALIDADDPYHEQCSKASATLPASPMVTTWPCLTEAMYFLYRAGGIEAQNRLWSFIADGGLVVYLPSQDEWQRIKELMNEYADMPLDVADASLISAAERLNDRHHFSIDQPLRAVRIRGRQFFEFIL
jgi:predicted nucleic acid-binding protein